MAISATRLRECWRPLARSIAMKAKQVRAPMPGDPLPRQRGWHIGVGGVVLLMLAIAWWSIDAATVPNGYLARRGWEVSIDGPWQFPHDQVRIWLSVMALEGCLAIWVLGSRWRMSLALRSGLLAAASGVLFLAMMPLALQSSAPFPQHLTWLFCATGWFLVYALTMKLSLRLRSWMGVAEPPTM